MPTRQPRTAQELREIIAPLNLTVPVLEIPIGIGAAEARTYTEAAPLSAPEFSRWARTVEHFQIEAAAGGLGWLRRNPQNLPVFVHPDTGLGLVISSGDEYTGIRGFRAPSTRNPKGASFLRTVEPNGQVAFFGSVDDKVGLIEVKDMRVLLYRERDGIVYSEVSEPRGTHGGRIVTWGDRILLPAFDVEANQFLFDKDGGQEDLQFVITRR